MKILSLLAPLINLLKNIPILYRIILIVISFGGLMSGVESLTASANTSTALTIEELANTEKSKLTKYIKILDVAVGGGNYLSSMNEETLEVVNSTYPVYSIDQIMEIENNGLSNVPAKVIIEDANIEETLKNRIFSIEGLYSSNVNLETISKLSSAGYNIASNVIMIKKRPIPIRGSKSGYIFPGFIFLMLGLLSFVPRKMYDKEVTVENYPEFQQEKPDDSEFV